MAIDGTSNNDSGSSKTLGIAYGPTSVVLFQKSIQDLSGGIGQPTRRVLESAVLEHEFGHLLGLVNTGTALQSLHQDNAHGAHCTNTNCLMYYQVDTSDFLSNLLDGSIPALDADCNHDLQSNGGK